MTGSNKVEIIIPHKNTTPPSSQQIIQQEENNTLTEETSTDEQGYYKEYIPHNTKMRLMAVMEEMSPILTQDQIITLAKILGKVFNNTECIPYKQKGDNQKFDQHIIHDFLKTKQTEGCSPNTITYYKNELSRSMEYMNKQGKSLVDCEARDLRDYIGYKLDSGMTTTGCDNIRRIWSSFFKWARGEHYTTFVPTDNMKALKRNYRVKKPLTNIEVNKIKDACNNIRDRAIIELFLSSGIRVGEMENLKIRDIDFQAMEFTVTGKGNKQRICYFNDVTRMYLSNYLEARGDDNIPWLWIRWSHYDKPLKPRKKVGKTGIEIMVRSTGKRAGVEKVHPHRFRHTFATRALDKGIPLEQVQVLLGHEQLDTTLIYAKVAREDVKYQHRKLMN